MRSGRMRSLRPSASRLRTGARLLEHCELKALLCPQRGAPLERVNPAYVARRPDLRAESAAMQHSPSFLGCDARACRSAAKVMPSFRVRKRRHSTLRTRRAAPLVAGVREKGESRIPTAWRCARSPTHLPAREPRRRLRIRDEETRSDGEDRKRERGTVTAPVRKRTEELVEPGQEGSEPRTDLECHPSGILGPMQIRHGSPPAHTESRGRD